MALRLSQSGPVVLAFVSFLVFGRLMQGGQQHARAIREGDRLTALGRAAEALTAYEAAVQRAPKNALGPSTVGITKTLLWQPDAALTPSLELAPHRSAASRHRPSSTKRW